MIDPNQCTFVDSRDDTGNVIGVAVQSLDRQRSLLDVDDDKSIMSLASAISWLRTKLKPTTSKQTELMPIEEKKPHYGHERHVILHLKQDGLSLSTMPPFVQSSPPFVSAAIHQNPLALQYASQDLRNDLKLVMKAVSLNGMALQYASSKLRDNASIAMVAVSQTGQALQYASRTLRNDKKIVLAAVLNDGTALEYASSTVRNEEDVVLTAVRQNKNAVRYLGHELLGRVGLCEIMEMVKDGNGGGIALRLDDLFEC